MTEFILGPAGSGKTTRIIQQIVDDLAASKRVILLVPEQMAVKAEAAVCTEAQNRSVPQTELEILNFRRLCNRVFREYGGIAYHSVSGGAKALILWKALFASAPFLQRYASELEDAKRFVPLLLSALNEFKSYGISPADLENASKECQEEDSKLSEKLADLSLIYAQYSLFLKEGYDDPADELTKLANILSEHNFFKGIHLYLDAFFGFTPQEFAVLSYAFRQAEQVTVSLCYSGEAEEFAFENVADTLRKLKQLAERSGKPFQTTHLTESLRFSKPELSYLERNLWKIGSDATFARETSAIRTVLASGVYSEAEFVANDITKKLREGAHYRDFAVIARDIQNYYGVIDAVFSKFSLPCHISRKVELSEKPLFKLILSALNIKNNGWNIEDVVIYMKTGLSPVTPDECDELEAYAYQWNIFGKRWYAEEDWFMNPDGFTDVMTEESYALLGRINKTRKKLVQPLVKLFESLDGTRTVRDICSTIFDFLLEIEADKKISEAGNDDEVRIWNCFCDTLDIMIDIVPDRKADSTLFANLFTLVVDQTNVGTLPAAVDEIAVGGADRIRTDQIRHVYLLGVNEGIFPAACSENSIFSDNDKAILEAYGICLSPDSNSSSVHELFLFYTAACCASESVTVVCSSSDVAGHELKPSIAFKRLQTLFPNAPRLVTDTLPVDSLIQNKKASFELTAFLSGTREGTALCHIFSSDPEYADFFAQDRQPLISKEEKLDRETAESIFGGDIALTQSRLDSYVLCAFGYECTYLLKLKKTEKYEFRASDTGTLVHRILEKFFSRAVSPDGRILEMTEEEIDRLIDEILEEYITGIFGTDREKRLTNRAKQLFLRLRCSVRILIRNLLEEFSQSEFVPRFFEMQITNSGTENTVAPLAIPLPDGNHAYLYGVADRVDICRKGEDVYVRVVDYKTGSKDFSLYDISLGLNLQMLIYLFSIWKDKNGTFRKAVGVSGEILPAGVLYCSAKTADVTVPPDTPEAEVLRTVADTLKRKGLLLEDEEILRRMEKKLEGKYIPVTLKKDGSFSTSLTLETIEGFGKLMDRITETISKLAYEIKCGEASPRPLKDMKHDGCRYCPHKSICRNPAAFNTRN